MAKFYGGIGYVKTEETSPGKWTKVVAERKYSGDFNRVFAKRSELGKVNADVNIHAEVSVVADPFLYDNLHTITYVRIHGVPWGVASITLQHPRLIISLGGVYNGEVAGDESTGTPDEVGDSSGL